MDLSTSSQIFDSMLSLPDSKSKLLTLIEQRPVQYQDIFQESGWLKVFLPVFPPTPHRMPYFAGLKNTLSLYQKELSENTENEEHLTPRGSQLKQTQS